MLSFWINVNQLIKDAQITQESLAIDINIPKNTLYGWISKDVLPRVDTAYKIAQALNTSVEFLVTGQDSNPYKQKFEELEAKIKNLLP